LFPRLKEIAGAGALKKKVVVENRKKPTDKSKAELWEVTKTCNPATEPLTNDKKKEILMQPSNETTSGA